MHSPAPGPILSPMQEQNLKNIALLIDADNTSARYARAIALWRLDRRDEACGAGAERALGRGRDVSRRRGWGPGGDLRAAQRRGALPGPS